MQSSNQPEKNLKTSRGLSREEKAAAALRAIALVVGTLIRLLPLLQVDFPLNDGGLFYAMVRDLQANQFHLPPITQYNHASLPFAYPPLAIYLAGGLNSLFGVPLLSLFRWLPLIFNLLCILVFYHFARQLFREPLKAGIAVLAFALLKPGYEWLIMGGGLTRSPAMLFALLTLDAYLVLLGTKQRRAWWIGAVTICYSLTFLTHIEIGWFTSYSLALLWLFRGRNKRNLLATGVILAGTIILTSLYWFPIVARHGMQPFLAGLFSGGASPLQGVVELFYFNFTEEPVFPVMAALALTGLIICILQKDFLIPAWLVLNALLDSRSVNRSDVIPAALLISVGIVDGLFLLLQKFRREEKDEGREAKTGEMFFTHPGLLLIFLLILQVSLSTYFTKDSDQALTHSLTAGDRAAMDWIRQNTVKEARFITLPASTWWEADSLAEWFPALSERSDATTVQGSEWSTGYRQKIAEYQDLNQALQAGTVTVAALTQKFPDLKYIYFPKAYYQNRVEGTQIQAALSNFPIVFQNDVAAIYELK
jgi:hypothetical protein